MAKKRRSENIAMNSTETCPLTKSHREEILAHRAVATYISLTLTALRDVMHYEMEDREFDMLILTMYSKYQNTVQYCCIHDE